MPLQRSEIILHVTGMDCANCALTLEHSLARLDGMDEIRVSFPTATLEAHGTISRDTVVEHVRALGYDVASPTQGTTHQTVPQRGGRFPGFLSYLRHDRQRASVLVALLLLLLSAPLAFMASPIAYWMATGAHVAAIVLAGYPIARKGVRSLVVGRQITIDLLMSIATLGAFLIGETGEAATVILLFAVGEALEGYAAERARESLRSLMSLAPEQATILRACMDCQEHLGQNGYTGGPCPFCGSHETTAPVGEVIPGDRILVRPSERIPLDGVVLSGSSSVNQAPITGESTPIQKAEGSEVFAGTINGEVALEVRATRPATDSTISRIIRLVEQAQAQRSPAERFVDRFARWYTPAVVVLAFLLASVPPLLFGAPFLDTPDGTRGWLYRALTLLIVACPCALVISTPVTVVSTLSALARRGILIKGGVYLDALARIRVFAFDKTGTLTEGRPAVIEARTPTCQSDQPGCVCEACDDMLALAAAVESRSEHPLAHAILAEAETRRLGHRYAPAEEVRALAGQGIQGNLGDSMVTVGSHTLFHDRNSDCDGLHPQVRTAEANGYTVMLVSRGDDVLGYVSVADRPRPDSRAALLALKRIDQRVRTVMLTGDNPTVARSVAEHLGAVDEVLASLLPADKLNAVRKLQEAYGAVAMVGDGVNDAPALAAATVGVAMGGAGTDQAMETADVVLMQDDLTHLPEAVAASRRAKRVIWQNIVVSLAIKAAFLALSLGGLATLWMAVFADMGASLLVTLNGMRMLRLARKEA